MRTRRPGAQYRDMDTLSPTADQPARVVDRLVSARLIDPARRAAALEVVAAALGPDEVGATAGAGRPSGRGVSSLVEVVAYLGAALVLAASGLFVAQSWGDLGFAAQVALLGVATVVLGAGGLLAAPADRSLETRRRLGGTLLTAAALGAATVTGLLVDRAGGTPAWDEPTLDLTLLAAGTVGLLVAALGHRTAPTLVGVLGMFAATCTVVATVPGPLDERAGAVVSALVYLAVAGAWLTLTERGLLGERDAARVLGLSLALWGAQTPLLGADAAWLAYLLTAALAVVATALYLRWGAWPYLAVAVVSVTVVVPEAVTDWTDGGLGVVGAVLVTGVTLLLASLLGAALRSRRPAGLSAT